MQAESNKRLAPQATASNPYFLRSIRCRISFARPSGFCEAPRRSLTLLGRRLQLRLRLQIQPHGFQFIVRHLAETLPRHGVAELTATGRDALTQGFEEIGLRPADEFAARREVGRERGAGFRR